MQMGVSWNNAVAQMNAMNFITPEHSLPGNLVHSVSTSHSIKPLV